MIDETVLDTTGLPVAEVVLPFDSRVTVLIVDDSDDQLQLLRAHFEKAGCNVIAASTAEAAMTAYGEKQLDLAVVDLMLPGMTGWEFTEQLGVDHPDCPVAISSVLEPDDYPSANASLPKPVNRQAVRQVLSDWVPRWEQP